LSQSLKILTAILVVFLLKVVVLLFGDITPETFENTEIAKNYLASGEMYYLLDGNVDYNHQFPFYGWIFILFFKIFGVSLLPVQILQIFLNALFSWVVYRTTVLWFPDLARKTWIVFSLLIISLFHPLLLYYQLYTIHPITLDVLIFASLLFVSLYWCKHYSIKTSVVLLIVLGITLLERSTLAVAILPSILLSVKNKDQLFRISIIMTLAIMVFAGPWIIRNHYYTGKIQMTSGTWRYLWVGIQEETDGTNVLPNGESYYALFPKEIGDNWSGKNLNQQLDFYKINYLMTWDESPTHVLKMWGVKIKNMFWFSSSAGGIHKDSIWVSIYKFLQLVLLVFVMIGLFVKRDSKLWLLFSACLALVLIQSFFYVETRHALPFHFIWWIGMFLVMEWLFSMKGKSVSE